MKLPYKIRGSGGVAIIVAVMMVTVVSGIAVKYSWQSELNVTRAGHRWISLQAQAYSHGAEQLAILTLKQDKEETTADSLEEIWAQGIEFPTDHGSMHMKLTDMQARFNLNSLKTPFRTQTQVTNSRNTVRRSHPKYHPEHLRFLRLLQTIPLDEEGTVLAEEEAAIILDAVKDWVDADDTIEGFGGAERDYYEQLEPPVTITNGDMISITELRFIKDLPIQIYQGLLPYVTTLPDTSELNVNTMGPWLMRTLNLEVSTEPLAAEDANQLFGEVVSETLESVADFRALPIMSTLFPTQTAQTDDNNPASSLSMSGLVFESEWFQLDTTVTVGDTVRKSRSLINRISPEEIRVVRRTDTQF